MRYVFAVILSLAATSAMAAETAVPEMSAGAGVGAIALLVGVAAIIRERTKRK